MSPAQSTGQLTTQQTQQKSIKSSLPPLHVDRVEGSQDYQVEVSGQIPHDQPNTSHSVPAPSTSVQPGPTASPRGSISEGSRYVPAEASPCEDPPPPSAPWRHRSTRGRSKPKHFAKPRCLESVPLLDLGDKKLTPLRLDKWLHHLQFVMTDYCPGLNPQDQARMIFYNVRERFQSAQADGIHPGSAAYPAPGDCLDSVLYPPPC